MTKDGKNKKRGFFGKIFRKEKIEEIIIEHDPTIIHFSEQDEHGLVVGSGDATFGAYKREEDEPIFKTGLTSDESYENHPINDPDTTQIAKNASPPPEKAKNLIKNSSEKEIAYIYGTNDTATNNNQNNFLEIIEGIKDINIDLTSHPEKTAIIEKDKNIIDIPLSISAETLLNIFTEDNLTIDRKSVV